MASIRKPCGTWKRPNLVLIDTSIWIDFLRRNDEALALKVEELIRSDEAIITGLILGEVLSGSRDKDEFENLERTLSGIRCLDDDRETFSLAANLAWQLRAKGLRIPLSDLSIAAHCQREAVPLLTGDRHFALIEEGLGKTFRSTWKTTSLEG